jgi:Zn-dependent M28 family amino/carboxypeptidase
MPKRALFLAVFGAAAIAQMTEVAGERIRAHVRFLASDLLEGRAPGTHGGELASAYIAAQFALFGAKPAGDNGSYLQNFSLVGVTPVAEAQQLSFRRNGGSGNGGGEAPLRWLDEFAGVTYQQTTDARFDAPAVFVGHGIVAPEYGWNDYAGIDVRGRVVVLFTGEPPSTDPKFFTGRALTYYGRWTYKYEEATRRGAFACIIVHTTPTASYGWEVVRSSWGGEDQQVKLAPGEPALALAGWVTKEVGDRIGAAIGKTADELLAMADTRGFRAVELPLRFRGSNPARLRTVETANVVARIEGSDPKLKEEAVVFSAHWDHLGVGEAVRGDPVYNGAVDNASGTGMLLEIARAWAALPQKPRRSAIFLAASAEEQGLLGSRFYAEHPVVAAGKTALAINFDGFRPVGRTRDVIVNGSERTTAYPLVEEAARRFGLTIAPDTDPEAGHYYRSDHFSLARAGIPAFSIEEGDELLGEPPGTGAKIRQEYRAQRYHQPFDEYREDWNFGGMEHYARFGLLIGINAANLPKLPTWRAGDEFLSTRQKSGVP